MNQKRLLLSLASSLVALGLGLGLARVPDVDAALTGPIGKASMPVPVSDSSAATGSDGRVYVFGGWNGSSRVNTVQVYSPSTDSWTQASPMPTALEAVAAVAAPNGWIYVLGGYGVIQGLGQPVATVEAYNPATDRWKAVAPMPTARSALSAVVGSDGRIYAMGGDAQGGPPWLAVVEAYDIATNVWTTVAPMPVDRDHFTAVAMPDGRILAASGSGADGMLVTETDAYDVRTNSWSSVPAIPTPRYGFGAALGADGLVYVFGGNPDDNSCCLMPVEAFDYRNDGWTETTATENRWEVATASTVDGRIFVIGGEGGPIVGWNTMYSTFLPPEPSSSSVPVPSPTPRHTPHASQAPPTQRAVSSSGITSSSTPRGTAMHAAVSPSAGPPTPTGSLDAGVAPVQPAGTAGTTSGKGTAGPPILGIGITLAAVVVALGGIMLFAPHALGNLATALWRKRRVDGGPDNKPRSEPGSDPAGNDD